VNSLRLKSWVQLPTDSMCVCVCARARVHMFATTNLHLLRLIFPSLVWCLVCQSLNPTLAQSFLWVWFCWRLLSVLEIFILISC